MGKIKEFLSQKDKIMHILCSCIIMLLGTALANLGCIYWVALLVGTLITAFCAFGKELYDSFGNGTASWSDIVADAIGWGVAFIPLLIIGLALVAL